MRAALTIIALWVALALPLKAQEVEVILPDTTLRVSSMGQVIPSLADRLAREGSLGRLGSLYRLGKVAWGGDEGKLTLVFYGDQARVPPPDTLVARDGAGISLPYLATFLRAADPGPGGFLRSASQPAWQVKGKSYFGYGPGYGVLYRLADVSRKTVQVLAAYDEQAAGGGRLVGEVTLDLPNLLGTLRHFRVYWRRLSPVTQTINLSYGEPRLPLLPLGARLSFYQDLRDTLYLQRDVKVQLTSLPGQGWSAAVGVGQRELRVTLRGREQGLAPYRLQNVNLALLRETYDHPVNPSRGYRVSLSLEGGTLAGAGVSPRAALGRGRLEAAWAGSRARLTLAQELQAAALAAFEFTPTLAEFARFGGSATVRGYREDQFLAPWGVVSRTELRYRTGAATRLHLFLDVGRIAGFDAVAAAGVGLVLRAGQNLIQLDLAWNRDDAFNAGKVHLRLINFL